MKGILLSSFILFSLNSFASPSQIVELAELTVEKSFYRQISENERLYVRPQHGPITEKKNKYKYGYEYALEVIAVKNAEGEFVAQESALSIMRLTYCDFVYEKPEDYSFERTTYLFSAQGELLSGEHFVRQYNPESNNGICGDNTKPSRVITESVEVSSKTWLEIQPVLEVMLKGIRSKTLVQGQK